MPLAYYNEHDPTAAAWLRELIQRKQIALGIVDETDVRDVVSRDLLGFTQCHFFAGIGVWSYALRQAGWPDDRPVWTGSCPCQPFSQAGKGKGTADERHLWPAWFHLIEICRPGVVFGEQVAGKAGLGWLDLVQADLEGVDYTSAAVDLCAAGVGAPHIRQRLYFVAQGVADPGSPRLEKRQEQPAWKECSTDERNSDVSRLAGTSCTGSGPTNGFWGDADWLRCRDGKWRAVGPCTFPLANGAPARVGRLRGYGNAICAPVAQAFIEAYIKTVGDQ